jgi:formate/nitrite transporter FocA (FNT family)
MVTEMINSRTLTVIAYVVVTVWTANFAAGLFWASHYHPDPSINAVLGALIGGGFFMRGRSGHDDGRERDDD